MKHLEKNSLVRPSQEYNFDKFVNDTSICTSTMIIQRDIVKGAEFTDTKICEDYYFKCKILKNV